MTEGIAQMQLDNGGRILAGSETVVLIESHASYSANFVTSGIRVQGASADVMPQTDVVRTRGRTSPLARMMRSFQRTELVVT